MEFGNKPNLYTVKAFFISNSLAEAEFLTASVSLPRRTGWSFTFLDYNIEPEFKNRIITYCDLRGYELEFLTYEQVSRLKNCFHFCIGFSITFRFCSPLLYGKLNFDHKEAILSEANGLVDVVKSINYVQKLCLNITKPGGIITLYPLFFDYELFQKLYGDNFKILDTKSHQTYSGFSIDEAYIPYSMHFSTFLKSNHMNCMELNDKKSKDIRPFIRDFNEVNPTLTEMLHSKGIGFTVNQNSSNCCISKTHHIDYELDLKFLMAPIQVETVTYFTLQIVSEKNLQVKFSSYWNELFFGERYKKCCGHIKKCIRNYVAQNSELFFN